MKVNVKRINGNWDLGYSLDKHVLSSIYVGENQWGHPEFNTTRSEIGQALYQLKYRSDYNQIPIISSQLYDSLSSHFSHTDIIIPMPPSKSRTRQPVIEIAQDISNKMGVPFYDKLLVKTINTPQLKDIDDREVKVKTLINALSINDLLEETSNNILIIDDLFDSGSSLEAATTVLREYAKIHNIYVATVTRKR